MSLRARAVQRAMFATAARWAAKKGKPKMAPIELTAPPEQAQSITRAIFDVVREHGPLTISDVWDHVKVHVIAQGGVKPFRRHPRTKPVRQNVSSEKKMFPLKRKDGEIDICSLVFRMLALWD